MQLPHLDNAPATHAENVRAAAARLSHAMERSGEHRHFEPVLHDPATDRLDNAHLLRSILDARPDVIAATLYGWNVERTVRLLRRARAERPGVRIVVGGPEVARRHPFLFRTGVADAAVVGEGEPAFPAVLRALRGGRRPDLACVGWKQGRGYAWGTRPPIREELSRLLPPAGHPLNRPDAAGMAYLETSRGCPMRCAFCCYNLRRAGLSFLDVREVAARVRVLLERGATEIRLIDPTFNAHPRFDALLDTLVALNPAGRVRFFAELRAETITPRQAERLARANFREIEIGIQSLDPAVLAAIRRPTDLKALARGVGALAANGIRLTLDVMCGLPHQTRMDVRRTVAWAASVRGARVQLLHTLLLPGTELRDRARALGLTAQPEPPYRVTRTRWMAEDDIRAAESEAAALTGDAMDSPARRYVGRRLPDLVPERVRVRIPLRDRAAGLAGRESRRAVLFQGDRLFEARRDILAVVRAAMRREPDMLWQFVLCPTREEPLDLLDALRDAIDAEPPAFLDRLSMRGEGRVRAARRVFILLAPSGRYARSWNAAAERLLAGEFW